MKRLLIAGCGVMLLGMSAIAADGWLGAGEGVRRGGKGPGGQHFRKQHEENCAFRKNLRDIPEGERLEAIIDHRTAQHKENAEFAAKRHAEHLERIRTADNLTDEQKNELIELCGTQYAENTAYREKMHAKSMGFLKALAADTTKTPEEKREALRAHHKAMREAHREHRKEQRTEWMAMRKKCRAQRPE